MEKIVEVKNAIKEKISYIRFVQTKYSIQWGCTVLSNFQQDPKVEWSKMVWERTTIPKHRFIVWLAWMGRLKTKELLSMTGMTIDTSCMLCGMPKETTKHLFFDCCYSKQ